VTSIPWKVVPPSDLERPTTDRAPAYRPADGAFALFNDYAAGVALLAEGPVPLPSDSPFPLWERSGRPGPRPLAPGQTIEGYGVFTFPYGPVSMGVPESGRFDVRTYGERILDLAPVGGFKSRRIGASVVGCSVADAALRVERTAGHVAAAHAAAFLAAVESALGLPVPREELWVRALAQELSRIYNHVHGLARVAEASSQNVGLAQAHSFAEEVLRLQGRHFGHRWLFGAFLPGGPTRHLEPSDRRTLGGTLASLSEDFDELWELFLQSRIFVDRIQTTCPVPRARAVEWGAVGPTLRACGVGWDDRLRVPQPPYNDLFLALPRETEGDALARVVVRAEEVRASFLLLEQMLDRWPLDAGATERPPPPVAPRRGIGRVESPGGDLVYDVTVSEDGRIAALGRRTASDANFPVLALGLREAVFTDFHFALESFGLSFAETDG
jgi:Ni,Fe-hydrogenase III large subunit